MELPLFLEESQNGESKAVGLGIPQFSADGRRQADQQKTLNVKIPVGVSDGERIRLKGQGAPGVNGGENGDLYLVVRLVPHPLFDVDGRDLIVTVPVAPWEAALGAGISVQTPSGTVEVTVPPGSQSGRKLRLKGRGIPAKTPGDLYLMLNVVLPPATSDRARELYETMARDLAFNPRERIGA